MELPATLLLKWNTSHADTPLPINGITRGLCFPKWVGIMEPANRDSSHHLTAMLTGLNQIKWWLPGRVKRVMQGGKIGGGGGDAFSELLLIAEVLTMLSVDNACCWYPSHFSSIKDCQWRGKGEGCLWIGRAVTTEGVGSAGLSIMTSVWSL